MMLEVVGAVFEDGNNMTRNTAARTAMVAASEQLKTSTGEATGCGAGAGTGRPRVPGGHRTGLGGPDRSFIKNVFFVDFNLARNEAPERGGREELLLESQEGQELSAGAAARQLVLNMISEDQTVDHTYMLMGNDHDRIFIDFSEYTGQTLKIVLKGPMTVHRPRTRYVHLSSHKTLTNKITRQHLLSGLMATFP
jgi:hypothetical protein